MLWNVSFIVGYWHEPIEDFFDERVFSELTALCRRHELPSDHESLLEVADFMVGIAILTVPLGGLHDQGDVEGAVEVGLCRQREMSRGCRDDRH